MIKITGKYNIATVFTNKIDEVARKQIQELCNNEIYKDSNIAIMPDVHAGKSCTIGTTMTISNKVIPNAVGVDIGCGMEVTLIKEKQIDFNKLDQFIRKEIPFGRNVRLQEHLSARNIDLSNLRCYSKIKKIEQEYNAIGSLGGGNHFIEIDKDDSNNLYIVIHSGSRHLGNAVANYYQNEAYRTCNHNSLKDIKDKIALLKAQRRDKEIQNEILKMKNPANEFIPIDDAYCFNQLFDDYIHDMKIMQQYANLNRKVMMQMIINSMNLTLFETFTTIHNYIDTEHMILRKGAVSAQANEKLIIPINMKEGSLICIGKGNKDWNYSAPHGAGRLYSRREAKQLFTLEDYTSTMTGIYSTSISRNTLDECPMAYKNIDDIVDNIKPTVDIIKIIKPIYNFKAD